jgi:two-component system, chemotaxis family, CheB/CheR fusion protein
VDEDNGEQAEQNNHQPILVAMGASAGGIRALQSFFAAITEKTGAAFVVVVHLDPERRSELPNILRARTHMPVVQVENRQKLYPDCIYVIPPDKRLQIVDHEIAACDFDEPRGHRAPIDMFFRSVAERLGDGFAVIFSGAGSDGALGVRAVKESGGIILVQDPGEAEYPSMPCAAIASGIADVVLPVRDLTQRLTDLIRLKQTNSIAELPKLDEELLRRVLAQLRVRTGHDFSKYKRSTVLRRIARRMQVTRSDDLQSYYEQLHDNPEEPKALLADLLISVTSFFRDPESFKTLSKVALPELFHADRVEPIRVWISGCATGEEAYSIAMLLLEEGGRHELRPPIQVFGSDLDARALNLARDGRYPISIETDVGEERLRRFFTREGDGYRVRQELRDMVLFAVHDLLKDPPFSRVDLISCRNVLIYVDRDLQEQVCSTFHYALTPGGYLLLGASESADSPAGLFRMVDRNARLFQSTARPGDKPRSLPRLLGPVRVREPVANFARGISPSSALNEAAMHRRAIEQVAPPSILVDEAHRVVHLSDHAGRYLLPSGGPLSGDIVDLVRPELRFELRSALNRMFEQQQSTVSLPILVRFNGHAHRVILQVKPVPPDEQGGGRTAIVMFIESEEVDENLLNLDHASASNETVRRLTQELELTQARLLTVREESDAANEELRAANEELQSINEEYRSTSEELETSKEELQSINEELQTVNTELKVKLEAISRAHSDLQNLMAATDIGTLFLDSSLRIKRFTERVTDLFSVTPADEGRPITDFAHQLEYEDLIKDVRGVLAELTPVRRECRSRKGQWYDMRIRPYRTLDDKIDGAVITFLDITERLQVEEALRQSERRLRQQKILVDLARDPIFVWDFDGAVLEWNRGCEVLYGFSAAEAVGKKIDELLCTTVPDSSIEAMRATLLGEGTWSGQLIQRAKDGRSIPVESRLHLEEIDGKRVVLETGRDIGDRKGWEDRQEMLLNELKHRVKNILAVVQAVAGQTANETGAGKEFLTTFRGRVAALASAQDLLAQSEWHGADLEELVRAELKPYESKRAERVSAGGEPVTLAPGIATPLGLIIHELAVNAAKYGSLSVTQGNVAVGWTVQEDRGKRLLTLTWRERNGPKVGKAAPKGGGGVLIERALPDAKITRELNPEGVVCTIRLPLAAGDERR